MRKIVKISAATVALVLASAGAASADESTEDVLSVSVAEGSLSISMTQAPVFSTMVPSASGEFVEAPMEITVSDLRGSGAGWNVYQVLDYINWAGDGENPQITNPLTTDNFDVTSMDRIWDMGSPHGEIPASNLPNFPASGDLGVGKQLLDAMEGSGLGTFEASFTVGMNVPANVLAGEYSGQMTTTVVSGSL